MTAVACLFVSVARLHILVAAHSATAVLSFASPSPCLLLPLLLLLLRLFRRLIRWRYWTLARSTAK